MTIMNLSEQGFFVIDIVSLKAQQLAGLAFDMLNASKKKEFGETFSLSRFARQLSSYRGQESQLPVSNNQCPFGTASFVQ